MGVLQKFCESFAKVLGEFCKSFARVLQKFCESFAEVLQEFCGSFVGVLHGDGMSRFRIHSKILLSNAHFELEIKTQDFFFGNLFVFLSFFQDLFFKLFFFSNLFFDNLLEKCFCL